MRTRTRIIAIAATVAAIAAIFFAVRLTDDDARETLTLTELQQEIADGNVASATLLENSRIVTGELADGTKFKSTFIREYGDELTVALTADPTIDVEVNTEQRPLWEQIILSLIPILVLIGAFVILLQFVQGSGSKMMQFRKAGARRMNKNDPLVTFADVAGADEAVEELREIKDFLSDPARFKAIGASIPKGVLLYGPPGTGKTLLARAVAGEAGVPFFSISGSDFVEMFVGVGASRVRSLFKEAKDAAPAIIFVDEIDAVGRHRGAGTGGGHDEREQTLNQMLVEMDGFDVSSGVIMIAATNRPDILDPALLRPGRFDRQIVVDKPDLTGRRKIVDVHAKSKPLGREVDLDVVARRTPGFTGADLQNLLNEAALLAARERRETITRDDIDRATDRVMAGAERRSRLLSDRDKLIIAYHEAGHALIGHVLPHTDPVHKVTIIPRGQALGWTLALPESESYLRSKAELADNLTMLLGGRTAEEIIFGDVTTGAANDIERATEIAKSMVTQFGMSEKLGLRKFGTKHGEVFLGKEYAHEPDYSDEVARQIDEEVRVLIDSAHVEAHDLLTTHRRTLDRLAQALIDHETLEADDLELIFAEIVGVDPIEDQLGHDVHPAGVRAVESDDTGSSSPVPRFE